MTIDAAPKDSPCSLGGPLPVTRIGERLLYLPSSGKNVQIEIENWAGNIPGHCHSDGCVPFGGSYHNPLVYRALSSNSTLFQAEASCVTDRGCH